MKKLKMTQKTFYREFDVLPGSKEQSLVLDLRDSNFSWKQVYDVFVCMDPDHSLYDWNIKLNTIV